MEKIKTRYVCQNCGHTSLRWLGKCPACERWDTLVEEAVGGPRDGGSGNRAGTGGRMVSLKDINTKTARRIPVGIDEFDRLLGNGIIPGQVILLGGEPGVGKSTLLLQVSCLLSDRGVGALYITGEESLEQIKLRAQRLGLSGGNMVLLNETNVETIISYLQKHRPQVVIIDSIQIMYLPYLSSAPGSVAQVRECTALLTAAAKRNGISLFLIGHITKTGAIAGPRTVEHLVDTVLYFEGDIHNRYRILRTLKNRFGSTEEIGIFNMEADGLHQVSNPSEIFLNDKDVQVNGSVVVASIEGTRPIMVEIQALVSPTAFGIPERRAIGLDYRRLVVLLAVLQKRAGLVLQNQDVFVNVAGGIKLTEPAVDLGLVMAVVSGFREVPVPAGTVAVGEVGLGGEIRPAKYTSRRVTEAERLGFQNIILPNKNAEQLSGSRKIKITGVDTVNEALELFVGKRHKKVCKQ